MFFHHPESEKSLRRMAVAALHGSAMEPRDFRVWARLKRVFKFVGWEALLAFLLCMLAGLKTTKLSEPAWRDFMLAGAVVLTSRVASQRFFWLLQSSPTMGALWHLPVAGRDICRWVRRKSLLGSVKLLPRMTVGAWAWLGFPALETAWMQILWNGVVLWLVMLACVQLYSLSKGAGRLLGKIWNLTLGVWLCMALYAWWWEKNLALGQPLSEWVVRVCAPASWLLPAQWAMHARENPIALVLTLVCLAAGGLFWWRFPGTLAIAYDRLANVVTPDSRAPDIEEEGPASLEAATLEPGQVLASIQKAAAKETALAQEGWIEKLVLSLLRKRDHMLGPILAGPHAGWTGRWWKALRISTLLLPASYALLAFGTRWIQAETLEFWTVIVPLIVVVWLTFPASNSIPIATLHWPLGTHAMPFFAGLPVSMRDLLRVSLRITAARMVACLALALPVIAALCLLLNQAKALPAMLGTAVIIAISWVLIRPAFIYYRLQQMSRPGRRHRFGHVCSYLLLLPAALGVMISVVTSLSTFQVPHAWPAILCVPFTACCARAIYAVFHWRVRTRKVDWSSDI